MQFGAVEWAALVRASDVQWENIKLSAMQPNARAHVSFIILML